MFISGVYPLSNSSVWCDNRKEEWENGTSVRLYLKIGLLNYILVIVFMCHYFLELCVLIVRVQLHLVSYLLSFI